MNPAIYCTNERILGIFAAMMIYTERSGESGDETHCKFLIRQSLNLLQLSNVPKNRSCDHKIILNGFPGLSSSPIQVQSQKIISVLHGLIAESCRDLDIEALTGCNLDRCKMHFILARDIIVWSEIKPQFDLCDQYITRRVDFSKATSDDIEEHLCA